MNETQQNPLSGVQRAGIPPAQGMPPTHESHRARNASIISAAIILLVVVAGWYATAGSRAVNALIRNAAALSAQSEYGEALQTLSGGLKTYTDSVPLNFAMARTVIEAARRIPPPKDDEDRTKIAETVRRNLSLLKNVSAPQFASEYHDIVASTYLLTGDSANALAHLKESLAADQTNVRALMHTGAAFEIAGDLKTASQFYHKAEDVLSNSNKKTTSGKDDTSAEMFIALGKSSAVLERDGKKAAAYFNKAADVAASNAFIADAHYAQSTLLYQENKIDESRAEAELAIAADQKSDLGYVALARAIVLRPKEGDEKKVGEYIWKAIQLNPTRALTRMLHGQVAHRAGNVKQAIASYGDALRLIDSGKDRTLSRGAANVLRADVYAYLALAYQADGKKKDASNAILSAFANNPLKVAYLVSSGGPFAPFKKSLNIQ